MLLFDACKNHYIKEKKKKIQNTILFLIMGFFKKKLMKFFIK